jgi:DNA processing protein
MPATETSLAETRAVVLVLRACLAARGVSGWQASAVIERLGSARRVLAGGFQPETKWELAVRSAVRDAAPTVADDERVATEMEAWGDEGIRLVTVLGDHYPLNLRFIWDRPPILWYRGELEAEDAYALAVVGTRNPTDEGRRRARKMARLLAERGVTVLSGLAKGIDTEAHTAALHAGGRTVAVLGHGHHHMYPKENAALAQAIADQGAVVSLFQPDTPPTRRTFPMRNVVTSGMGQGTTVIQASRTSGARLQARLAVEHGKHAFFLRSLVEEYEWAREFASKRGAITVSDVEEVLPYLRDPSELARLYEQEGDTIRAANAEPPPPVQRRMVHVAGRDQQQLSL